MKFTDTLIQRFQANPKLCWTGVVYAAAFVLQTWPWLLAWLPIEQQKDIQMAVYLITKSAILAVIWWAKQHNTAGTGAADDPLRKPDRNNVGSHSLRNTLLVIFAASLSGCAGISKYNSHVAAREDSLSGFAKDGNFGGSFTHRVEYR